MNFLPREVVMVFHIKENLDSEVFGDVLVDEGMVGCCILSHQVHGSPVFLAVRAVEGEPSKARQFLWQLAVL